MENWNHLLMTQFVLSLNKTLDFLFSPSSLKNHHFSQLCLRLYLSILLLQFNDLFYLLFPFPLNIFYLLSIRNILFCLETIKPFPVINLNNQLRRISEFLTILILSLFSFLCLYFQVFINSWTLAMLYHVYIYPNY